MLKIPFTDKTIVSQSELEEYGLAVGRGAAALQHEQDSAYVRFVADAYEEQIRQMQAVNLALANFASVVEGYDEEKASLVAKIEEFSA